MERCGVMIYPKARDTSKVSRGKTGKDKLYAVQKEKAAR